MGSAFFDPQIESMPTDSLIIRPLGILRFYSGGTCSSARSGRIEPFLRMAGLVPASHVSLAESLQERRGCPTSAGMTLERWFDFIGTRSNLPQFRFVISGRL